MHIYTSQGDRIHRILDSSKFAIFAIRKNEMCVNKNHMYLNKNFISEIPTPRGFCKTNFFPQKLCLEYCKFGVNLLFLQCLP